MSTHLAASFCGVPVLMTRSRMGLPYFDSPELEVGRLVGRLDEVALRVDVEEAHGLAPDLPAHDEVGARVDVALHEEGAVLLLHLAQRVAHEAAASYIESTFQMVARALGGVLVAVQEVHHALRHGEVAGGEDHDHAVVLPLEDAHLA